MSYFCAVSNASNGSMKSTDQNYISVLPARTAFLQQYELKPENTTLVQVTYGSNDYCRYHTLSTQDQGNGITRPAGIEADALVISEPRHALLLPLADCVGAVIYDPSKHILMVSHLGRHNLEQFGGTKSIEYLVDTFGSKPRDLLIWLSPSAGKENYPLYRFDNRSLQEVSVEQLTAANVTPDHIKTSEIDTTTNSDYFSHSQFLKRNRDSDGRFAIIAALD